MKKRIFILALIITLFTGCGENETLIQESGNALNTHEDYSGEDYISTDLLKSEVETKILNNSYHPSNIELVLITENDNIYSCSIHIPFDETKDTFLEQCYFALYDIIDVFNTYQLEWHSISIKATYNDDTSQLICLDYYAANNEITVLDNITEESSLTKYTYEQLNVLNLANDTNLKPHNINSSNAIIIVENEEKEGYFDGNIQNGYADGKGVFYSSNSKELSYELHANFINGYLDGESELLFDNGNKVYGFYTMGLKNGTFTCYDDTIGEYSDYYENGIQIGDTTYIKVNDSCIKTLVDELLQSDDNPANWTNEKIGIAGITDANSSKYKNAISTWRNAISEYEDSVFQTYANFFGMKKEDVEAAYLRACSGEESFTYITPSTETTNQ